MAEGRRGLGRGLSALLDEVDEGAPPPPGGDGVREIPIELIHRNPEQPRRHFSEAEIEELAESLRHNGVLQPILVRPSPLKSGEFEIVAGERRWRAAQKTGLTALPALVRTLNDERAYEISLIENIQREDLNPLEEASGYLSLVHRFGYTQDKVATAVGKSRSHVANMLRLTQLPEGVRDHVIMGRLSAGHARALLTAKDPQALADLAVEKGLSVREVEALARGGGEAAPKKASGPRRSKDTDTAALEVDLEDALGMKVDIVDRGGVGELKIRYATLEQLDELCRRLTRR
ncbi:MAG: ParB/RepB/Spo0J family partition protein [Proteobacteria bacterium]|nr:ParB/RepB/Spo0J family partition protein [Pseudomonadota bacterium]